MLCCNEAFCDDCKSNSNPQINFFSKIGIRKKSRCPSCNNEVHENNIIPNKILREKIERNTEQTVDVPSPTNAYSSKPSEPVDRSYHSYEEPRAPPPLEKRDSSPSQDLDTTNAEDESYSRPSIPGIFLLAKFIFFHLVYIRIHKLHSLCFLKCIFSLSGKTPTKLNFELKLQPDFEIQMLSLFSNSLL